MTSILSHAPGLVPTVALIFALLVALVLLDNVTRPGPPPTPPGWEPGKEDLS